MRLIDKEVNLQHTHSREKNIARRFSLFTFDNIYQTILFTVELRELMRIFFLIEKLYLKAARDSFG